MADFAGVEFGFTVDGGWCMVDGSWLMADFAGVEFEFTVDSKFMLGEARSVR